MEVLDELNMTMLEIDAAYSPDYNLIGTVNDMCYYIQKASKHLEKQDTDAHSIVGESERGLNLFLESFDVAVNALKRLNLPDLTDFIFLFLALSKLNSETVKAFDIYNQTAKFIDPYEFKDEKEHCEHTSQEYIRVTSHADGVTPEKGYLNKTNIINESPDVRGEPALPIDRYIRGTHTVDGEFIDYIIVPRGFIMLTTVLKIMYMTLRQ
nr:unnamed protein product [Callosobruchus analis]